MTLPFFPNNLQDLQFWQSTQIKEASKAPRCSLSCCENFVHSCLHHAASSLCLATASLCSTTVAVRNVSDSSCHCWVEQRRQLSSENLQAEKKQPKTNQTKKIQQQNPAQQGRDELGSGSAGLTFIWDCSEFYQKQGGMVQNWRGYRRSEALLASTSLSLLATICPFNLKICSQCVWYFPITYNF